METFSADRIVGANMYAQERVPVKSGAYDDSQVIGYVEPGKMIGVVDSYVVARPSSGRSRLHWMFRNDSGGIFYVAHDRNLLEVNNVYTPPQEEESAIDQIVTAAKWGVGIFVSAQILRTFLR